MGCTALEKMAGDGGGDRGYWLEPARILYQPHILLMNLLLNIGQFVSRNTIEFNMDLE
jgi:hypothetical protein